MKPERMFHLAVALAFAGALLLRLWGIGELTLTQWDEGPYAGYAMGQGPVVREDPLIIYAPPLYPGLCGAAYALFGADPRLAIAVAALLGALAVFPVALLGRRLAGAAAGACAAWLLALAPLHLAHSRLALTETTFTALCLTALWFGARALRSARTTDALLLGACSGLAVCTKFHGFLPLAATGAGALFEVLRGGRAVAGRRLRVHVRTLLVATMAFVPFVIYVLGVIRDSTGMEAFTESRKVWTVGLHPYAANATVQFFLDATWTLGAIGLLLLAVFGAVVVARRARDGGDAATLAFPIVLFVMLSAYRNYTRLLVPLEAALIPLAAAGAASVARRFAPRLAPHATVSLCIIAAATGVAPILEALRFRVPDGQGYPEMARRFEAQIAEAPGSAVAVAQQALFPYLNRDAAARLLWITERSGQELIAAGAMDYLVTDQDPGRHGRVNPHLDKFVERLELLAEVANPLPAVVLFDRLHPAGYRRYRADPEAEEFAAETHLRLYRLR